MLYVVAGLMFGVFMQSGALLVRVPENVASANLIRSASPVYPPQASRASVEGDVFLEAEVDGQGAVVGLRVISGHPLLIESAAEAVRQYRYNPEMLHGESRVVTTVRVTFARERGKAICGPFESVRLYKAASLSDRAGTVDCGAEVIVLSRTMGAIEVETPAGARGWINARDVTVASRTESSVGTPAAAIAEASLDCGTRPTVNIFDSPGATVISRLTCGETVSILAQDDPYAKIRTAAGIEGWVLVDSLTRIR